MPGAVSMNLPANPFNGIESAVEELEARGAAVGAGIHSMELKASRM